ncbi:MAG: hypothetical protein HWD61_04665 [Parachlamydiaceae bacterium]|nr:MAG: hypothetical protein HWD61_04665 [Parachlamydiaceae bacterium]
MQKRYPGKYVSWGSLSDEQKEIIRLSHHSLEGFQTEYSSSIPAPSQIEPMYANAVPGPLYVDLDTQILLGWKQVPLTDLEVLVVQNPKEFLNFQKRYNKRGGCELKASLDSAAFKLK